MIPLTGFDFPNIGDDDEDERIDDEEEEGDMHNVSAKEANDCEDRADEAMENLLHEVESTRLTMAKKRLSEDNDEIDGIQAKRIAM